MFRVQWTSSGEKDYYGSIKIGWYASKMAEILAVLRRDPFEPTPGHRFKKLKGKLKSAYSRDINYHNRIVYTVHPNTNGASDRDGNPYAGIVLIHCAWGHEYDQINLA